MKTSRYTKKKMAQVKDQRDCYIEFQALKGKEPRLSIAGTPFSLMAALTFLVKNYADDCDVPVTEVIDAISEALDNYAKLEEVLKNASAEGVEAMVDAVFGESETKVS